MMDIAINSQYINSAYSENKRTMSVLVFVKIFFQAIGIILRSEKKGNFIDGWFINFSNRLVKTIVGFNSSLKKIQDGIIEGHAEIKNPKDVNDSIKEIIKSLTKTNERLEKINYFNNEDLKSAIKKTLRTSYTIEVKSKTLILQSKKSERTQDELFQLLASQPKHISRAS